MSLGEKAGKAFVLLTIRKFWGALISLGVMAYLARTLDKEDFGILAISNTLIQFIALLGISGIGEYIIFYNGKNQKEVVHSAFWLNNFIGIIIIIVIAIAAPFWSQYYGDDRIEKIIYFLLIGFSSTILTTIPKANFRKQLDYKQMLIIETAFNTINNFLQVFFAYSGYGVFSLVIPNAIISPFLALTLLWKSNYRPKLNFYTFYWKEIMNYTKHVIGSRVLGRFANEGDTLLVGKVLGMEALGIYNLAFQLANMFNTQFLPMINNIVQPVFSKNNQNIGIVRNHYLKMISFLSFICFPIILGQILYADTLIKFLYGDQWDQAIVPFQIVSLFVLFRSISSPTSGIYNALGKPKITFYFTLAFTPIFLIVIYLSSYWGLLVFCWSLTIIRNFGSIFHILYSSKLIGLNYQKLIGGISPHLISSIIGFGIILLVIDLLGINEKHVFFIPIFLAAYFFIEKKLFTNEVNNLLLTIKAILPQRVKNLLNY